MNTLGNIFKVHSFGESHGKAVGCVIDGCPAGVALDLEMIQAAVDKRKTAQQSFSSQRKESDTVQIISGVFEGKTLGAPICILIHNEDAQSKDYSDLKDIYRPGHADYTNQVKYGARDYRGGGRTSIRITAPMVAAGEIARQFITTNSKIYLTAFVSQIGNVLYDVSSLSEQGINSQEKEYLKSAKNNTLSDKFNSEVQSLIKEVQEEGDTLGGRISVVIENIMPGLGEPVFGKFQAQLSQALFSINTVKALEFGRGVHVATMKGSEHNDAFIWSDDKVETKTNHHGGLLGGISSGDRITFSLYFKPISSIQIMQNTINKNGDKAQIEIKGRHDVCAVPRAVPIVEAYTFITLANLILQHQYAKI